MDPIFSCIILTKMPGTFQEKDIRNIIYRHLEICEAGRHIGMVGYTEA